MNVCKINRYILFVAAIRRKYPVVNEKQIKTRVSSFSVQSSDRDGGLKQRSMNPNCEKVTKAFFNFFFFLTESELYAIFLL